MTTEHPPTLGLVLAGGLARRMGGGDKALIEIGGVTILERVLEATASAMRGLRAQRQWRSARALRLLAFRSFPTTFRISPARWPAFSRARLGGGERACDRMGGERAGRLPVSAERSGRPAA